jgi:hypothetical protein
MAALALYRNLTNGSITTGGTAAAQTFASGVAYTSMPPAGFRFTLTMGFTNPGAFTLNMDGIGAQAVKTAFGGDPDVGVFPSGMYVEFIWNGTNFIVMPSSQSADPALGGFLQLSSATQLLFGPKAGNKIKINGVQYVIPDAGIAGMANTSVFVNGVGGSNLAANTTYYVFAFNNAGTITGDFRTDGNGHMVDTTAGNKGVEVRVSAGTTPDATRTLIGLIRTNASSQFVDSQTNRLVRSWFNRRRVTMYATYSTTGFGSNSVYVDVSTTYGNHAGFVAFSDDAVVIESLYNCSSTIVGDDVFCSCGIDGAAVGISQAAGINTPVAGFGVSMCAHYAATVAEGFHFMNTSAATSSSSSGASITGDVAGSVG